ncbi:MAG: hypothetical protein V1676_02615 [Candidatus Diapherotrites archaeon]
MQDEPEFPSIEIHALFRMVDRRIIRNNYKPVETIASKIRLDELRAKYDSRITIKKLLLRLRKWGFVSFHGKSLNVASATDFGVNAVGKYFR